MRLIELIDAMDSNQQTGHCRGLRYKTTNLREDTLLLLKPIAFKEACDFIALRHRHHKPPQGAFA